MRLKIFRRQKKIIVRNFGIPLWNVFQFFNGYCLLKSSIVITLGTWSIREVLEVSWLFQLQVSSLANLGIHRLIPLTFRCLNRVTISRLCSKATTIATYVYILKLFMISRLPPSSTLYKYIINRLAQTLPS